MTVPAETHGDRVDGLLDRMTLAEKAGLLFHTKVAVGDPRKGNAALGTQSAEHLIRDLHLTHLHVLGPVPDPEAFAHWHNRIQDIAADTGLGVPVTFSTDPRHAFTENIATSAAAGAFSQWPEMLGFGALRDPDLVRRFADIARREYLAVGLRLALHPQVDLITEPRWARGNGGFSEDADLTAVLTQAYIRGFQGDRLGPDSVATVTKHFPGGGPQKDGEDPHFDYGKEQVYPGGNFDWCPEPEIRCQVREIQIVAGKADEEPILAVFATRRTLPASIWAPKLVTNFRFRTPAPRSVPCGHRRRRRLDHALLRHTGRNPLPGSRIRLQPGHHHRPAPRPVRL